ncbi:flagellar protein FlgN [Pelagicoccus sp. NFK12]|uniref:Flagellar protein FlgN n=1 Tax=Pelagicoccus enzymogenes TaxID=2773457 RepID=A0A927IGC2_9BACT|nr:flagellar protein FlgN [Pelagicoccus enzymogenes]MBD5778649.1 flagellar protein FlgN [Pelagicoccus enzymogenes]MDQ8196979.1 flagellar protein FlgN [Pelagicoccus enzymogenes]
MSNNFEEKDWNPLVELLRNEVQEYGGLYNLLERQQDEIFSRDPELVLKTNSEIESYMSEMGGLREQREAVVRDMARGCGADEEEPLSKLIVHFPDFMQPMLQALVDEINHMIRRTRQKARQNFMLLSRTMEINHETMQKLQPENYNRTYTKKGRVGVKTKLPTRYQAFV